MKILYITTVSCTMNFFKSIIGELIEKGHTVDLACNSVDSISRIYHQLGCKIYDVPFSRNPLKSDNLKAYKALKKIVENGNYDVVHCHTPVAAMCTRFSCRYVRKKGTRVFYTAHGFHFYKGAPLKNWLLYYPMEKLCSYFTDLLITINKEDFALAQKKMKAKKVAYVPGVGIDTEYFINKTADCEAKREELAVPKEAFLMLSVGELNENKNHKIVIEAMAKLDDKNIYYAIAGEGDLHNDILAYAKHLCVEDRIRLLGYRNDVVELYKTADCLVHPSLREGLPVSIMEAMACGLPIIASNIRGNNDLINRETGYVFNPLDSMDFCSSLTFLQNDITSNTLKRNDEILKYDKKTINRLLYDLYLNH